MGSYIKIGFQLAIQIALGFWVMEIEIFLASFIDVASNAAMVILLNTQFVIFMFPYCIMIAATIFVGKSMG